MRKIGTKHNSQTSFLLFHFHFYFLNFQHPDLVYSNEERWRKQKQIYISEKNSSLS